MARQPRKLIVILTEDAANDLEDIWDWSAKRFGIRHANGYKLFLQLQSQKLATNYPFGKPVPDRPAYRYVTISKPSAHYGHVIAFQVTSTQVQVLGYFHTARNWPELLDNR